MVTTNGSMETKEWLQTLRPAHVILAVMTASAPAPIRANEHAATTCEQASVVAAVDAASPGDTILVPAGSCTWSATQDCPTAVGNVPSMLCIRKGVRLRGGIGGETTLTLSGPAPRGAIKFSPDADALARNDPIEFSGFTVDSAGQTYAEGSLTLYPFPSLAGILDNVKIHDNVFKNSTGSVVMVNGPVYGVMYSNTFMSCGGYMVRWEGGDAWSWDRVPREYGTGASFFFEDNTIRFAPGAPPGNDAFMTGQGAPGLVMRYNTFDLANSTGGELGDVHGLQSMKDALPGEDANCGYEGHNPCDPTRRVCQQWSTIKTELYGNLWTNLTHDLYLWIVHRGSWLLMFNNTLEGTGRGAPPQYSQYSCDSCTSAADQPSMHVQNTYVWNNTANGSRMDLTKRLDFCSTAMGAPYTITQNRDFWNFNPNPLDGHTQQGIHCGATAPTSPCSTGDAYWQTSHVPCSTPPTSMVEMKTVTQAGRLFRCASPNHWQLYYQPFAYPHPLRSASPVTSSSASIASGGAQGSTSRSAGGEDPASSGFTGDQGNTEGDCSCLAVEPHHVVPSLAAFLALGLVMLWRWNVRVHR